MISINKTEVDKTEIEKGEIALFCFVLKKIIKKKKQISG